MSEDTVSKVYILWSRELSLWMDKLMARGLLDRKHELIRLAVVVSLHHESSVIDNFVQTDRYQSLAKTDKAGIVKDVNYAAREIEDPDGLLVLLIKRYGGDRSQRKYDVLEALVNFGLWVIYQHFYDDIIRWDKLALELENPSKIPV